MKKRPSFSNSRKNLCSHSWKFRVQRKKKNKKEKEKEKHWDGCRVV
jgi:hypothetical protein